MKVDMLCERIDQFASGDTSGFSPQRNIRFGVVSSSGDCLSRNIISFIVCHVAPAVDALSLVSDRNVLLPSLSI